MLHVDGSGNTNGTENEAELENAAGAVVADLVSCRREIEKLDGEHQDAVVTHNAGLYRIAQRIVGDASKLRDNSAWERFVKSPEWGNRKRPKSRDQGKALRHAVRFVLAPGTSRQVRSYWTISLEILIGENVAATEIAAALRERGGFESICEAWRQAKRNVSDEGRSDGARLFKKPLSSLPKVLRNAIITHQDGRQSWVEDGNDHTLLFLRVPASYRERLQPGEVNICAVIGHDDLSILDITELELKAPSSAIRLRHNPDDLSLDIQSTD